MKTKISSLIMLSVMLLAVGLGGSASGAQPVDLNNAGLPIANSAPGSDPVGEVANFIFKNFGQSGFAGLETDRESNSLTVYWRGDVPTPLRNFAMNQAGGVTVHFKETALVDQASAEVARERILASSLARRADIRSTSISHEGLGLRIVYANDEFSEQEMLEQLSKIGQTAYVQVELNKATMHLFASRGNDAPPYKAGARTVHYGQQKLFCTTGFALLTAQGYGRLLSAGHCDPSGNGAVTDGNLDTISAGGAGVSFMSQYDSLLIDPIASPATQPSMYYGSYSSSSYKSVLGWAPNALGDYVCVSGASTGSHCGTIYNTTEMYWTGYANVPVIKAAAPAGSIMLGDGDSGAPVTFALSNGVQARGIAIGNDPYASSPLTNSCGNVNPDVVGPGFMCSRYVSFVPIGALLNAWNLTLETA